MIEQRAKCYVQRDSNGALLRVSSSPFDGGVETLESDFLKMQDAWRVASMKTPAQQEALLIAQWNASAKDVFTKMAISEQIYNLRGVTTEYYIMAKVAMDEDKNSAPMDYLRSVRVAVDQLMGLV